VQQRRHRGPDDDSADARPLPCVRALFDTFIDFFFVQFDLQTRYIYADTFDFFSLPFFCQLMICNWVRYMISFHRLFVFPRSRNVFTNKRKINNKHLIVDQFDTPRLYSTCESVSSPVVF
jgi:hypothetical protein